MKIGDRMLPGAAHVMFEGVEYVSRRPGRWARAVRYEQIPEVIGEAGPVPPELQARIEAHSEAIWESVS